MYKFTTFKIIPEEFMDTFVQLLGFAKTNDSGILKDLNTFLIAGLFSIFVVIFIGLIVLIKKIMKSGMRAKCLTLQDKLVILIVNGVHQTINNGAIPLQVTAFVSIARSI